MSVGSKHDVKVKAFKHIFRIISLVEAVFRRAPIVHLYKNHVIITSWLAQKFLIFWNRISRGDPSNEDVLYRYIIIYEDTWAMSNAYRKPSYRACFLSRIDQKQNKSWTGVKTIWDDQFELELAFTSQTIVKYEAGVKKGKKSRDQKDCLRKHRFFRRERIRYKLTCKYIRLVLWCTARMEVMFDRERSASSPQNIGAPKRKRSPVMWRGREGKRGTDRYITRQQRESR